MRLESNMLMLLGMWNRIPWVIRVNRSPRADEFYPRILKESREEIARAMTDIFVIHGDLVNGIQNWLCQGRQKEVVGR